jgi:hypothetical protein
MSCQKWKGWALNVAVIFVSTSVMLAISELALRLFYPQQLGIWFETRDGLAIHQPNGTIRFLNHDIHINSLGMRDQDHAIKKKDGVYRILLLGDSFMEALQVPFEESFPKLLEERLRKAGLHNVEVINAAVSGWGTEDELAYLTRYGKRLEPNLILVAMTLHNDVSDNLREKFYTLKDGRLQRRPVRIRPIVQYWVVQFKAFIASHLHVIQLWRKFWYRADIQNTGRALQQHVMNLLSSTETTTIARGWQLTFAELRAIQSEGRSIGVPTVVVLIPLSLQLSKEKMAKLVAQNSSAQQDIEYQKPQEIMVQFGARQGLEIIDLLPTFRQWGAKRHDQLYLKTDGHWNTSGHSLAAEHVASELRSRGLVGG